MAFHRTSSFLVIVFLLSNAFTVMADVGTRHLLLQERATLQSQLDNLSADLSPSSEKQADSLTSLLLDLDGRIIASYDQTLSRLSAQQRRRATNDRALTLFALVCCLVALASILALWLAQERVKREDESGLPGLYRQLFRDLLLTVRPEKADSPALTRVSPVIILGILGMMFSILVYLLSSLH